MECSKNQQPEDIAVNGNNASKEAFPWLPKFNKMIHSSTGSKNYQLLEQSLLFYIQNILSSIGESNEKSYDTVNLKNHISNMLIFFHLYWLDIKQDIADHSSYLNKISALLIIYIDMELKTSMEKKTFSHVKNSSKIAAKLLAALYIYLNSSEEHIFRVLLRIKRATEKYTKVCDYIFTKSFTYFTTKITPVTDITYVRYLLAFKIWEKMEESSERKKKINKLAPMLLGSRMPKLRDELLEFIPEPPTNQENETLWLLQSHVFDLKQVHKCFLLLEDKMDLQCNKVIYTTQTYLKYQEHQINSICYQDNSEEINNDEQNKNSLTGLQNHKIIPMNINENKSMNQVYLIKKKIKNLKPLKKMRKKTGKTIIIDLTGDEETSVPHKMKRKKKYCEQIKTMKKYNLQKHINTSKYSNQLKLTDANVQKIFNQDKSSINKILSECKFTSNNKISDDIECHNLIDNKSLLDKSTNVQEKEHLDVTKDQMSNPEFGKEDEMQHDDNHHNLKLSRLADSNIKEFKAMTNVLKENKSENPLLSHMTYVVGNTANSYGNSIMQNKEILTSQEESAMETIPSFKVCQDNIADQHSLKQELPTSMNCSAMQKSHKCCEAVPVDKNNINCLIIQRLKSIDDQSSQIIELIKQRECHQVNECTNCYMKTECKPFVLASNNVTAAKIQNTLHNTFNDNENDVKSGDTNIIYMLSDRNKYVYVVNHVDERVTTVHTEKRMQCLDKPIDMCTVSTMFTGDQIIDSPLHSQHVNFDNIKINDYGIKYPETAIKEQQEKNNCDTLLLNDRIHSSESCIFDINSFEIDPNEELDYESQFRNFPKIEEANETMKTDYADDLENISFVHNIQSETLEDFLQQPFMTSQINYDNSIDVTTKKPFVTADNDAVALKTQDTLSNKFGDIENSMNLGCNTNMVYMLSDRNKCLTNHIGECIMTANAGKKIQCLDKSSDICSVSNNFKPDQVIQSPLDTQHINFDPPRANNYEYSSKYSIMKKQKKRSNCITSNDQKHSSESCTSDINPFEIQTNSKELDYEFQLRKLPKTEEVNELMKTDGIDDLENNHFQSEILEDFFHQSSNTSQMSYDNSVGMSIRKDLEENILSATVSNDITESLLQKQCSGKLNNVRDILLSQKTISCNNQNDVVEDNVDPVAFHLNADDIFLQLPVQFDKTMFQGAVEFRYSY